MLTRSTETRPSRDIGPTASLQFKVEPELVPWLYASLMNQPQVDLFNGEFPEPFSSLVYFAQQNQRQLLLAANLTPAPDFTARYGSSIGSPMDLAPLLLRYPQYHFSPDGQQLFLTKNDQPFAAIARDPSGAIVIQRGAQAGPLTLSQETPVNDLSVHLDQFDLLVQRYVNAIWRASPETNQKQMLLTLNLSNIPEDATTTYLSTLELIGKEYSTRTRPLDLDDEIGGYPLVKSLVRSLVLDSTKPEVSRAYGTQENGNKFVLVTGREGTGKSLFPKALDTLLRAKFPGNYEYYRLPLEDILPEHGPDSVVVIKTILDRARSNEKNGIPTLLHLDRLEQLVPPGQNDDSGKIISPSEFSYSLRTRNPVISALRQFGIDLGGDSHHIIVYGESRLRRGELPEGIQRLFRRAFHLDPTAKELAGALVIQIRTTRSNAARTGNDPFASDLEPQIPQLAEDAVGLTGRDVQQAILNIAMKHKAAWESNQKYIPTTAYEVRVELNNMLLEVGVNGQRPKRKAGFVLPHERLVTN